MLLLSLLLFLLQVASWSNHLTQRRCRWSCPCCPDDLSPSPPPPACMWAIRRRPLIRAAPGPHPVAALASAEPGS